MFAAFSSSESAGNNIYECRFDGVFDGYFFAGDKQLEEILDGKDGDKFII
jgi:hypothetical protein